MAVPPKTTRLRRTLRDWLLFPCLLAYIALLILSALAAEVRPDFMDSATWQARQALSVVGVQPGIVVFQDEEGIDEKWRAFCIKARGFVRAGGRVDLYPADMRCVKSGFRFRLPPMHLALRNILTQSWTHHMRWQGLDARDSQRVRRDRVVARVGSYMCDRGRRAGHWLSDVKLIWYAYQVRYSDGSEQRGGYLNLGFDCDLRQVSEQTWFPDESAIVSFWGEEPWE